MHDFDLKEKIKIVDHHFDDVMEAIGWFGKFTVCLYVVMYLSIIYGAMNIVGAVFLAANIPHHCEVDRDIVDHVLEDCQTNWTEAQLNLSLPFQNGTRSQCEIYSREALLNISCDYWRSSEPVNFTSEQCTNFWYDRSTFYSSAIMDFNLVCSRKWKQELSQLLLMLGVLIGAMFCGIGSDRWGRRPCFLFSLIVLFASSVLTSVVKVFWLFTLVRLFVGVGAIGLCISGVVYAMEITSVRHRVVVSQTLQASFSFGFMLLALFGYLERRWVFLNLIISIPILALIPFYIFSSLESPRWLISCNRGEKALEVLDRMAAANKKDLQVILQEIKEKNEPIFKEKREEPSDVIIVKQKYTTLELFRNPSLRQISLVLFYNWFTVTCIYYGLTLNTASLAGSVFLNFFLGGLIEIPANYGVVPIIHWWGRRPVICLCNIICGASLFCMMFVPEAYHTTKVVLFLVGKFGVTATFSCIYLYSSELYPTPLRGNGLGVCSGSSRLGGLTSLLILMLRHINRNLPFVVFGGIAAVAGFLIVLLPETRGIPLPETVEDTERLHKHREITLFKQFIPYALRKCC